MVSGVTENSYSHRNSGMTTLHTIICEKNTSFISTPLSLFLLFLLSLSLSLSLHTHTHMYTHQFSSRKHTHTHTQIAPLPSLRPDLEIWRAQETAKHCSVKSNVWEQKQNKNKTHIHTRTHTKITTHNWIVLLHRRFLRSAVRIEDSPKV